jgi:endo-1,4-beta-xylanase
MKAGNIVLLLLAVFALLSCDPPPEGINLTIGDSKNLSSLLPEGFAGQELTWKSSDPETVSVTDDGVITALKITGGGGNVFVKEPAAGTAVITVSSGRLSHSITVNATVTGHVDIMDLPPIKDQFKEHFALMGNIYNNRDVAGDGSSVTSAPLARHYNILTPENNMKPDNLSNNRDAATGAIAYNFTTADRMVNAALASGIKVHGHTLIWHQQIPKWQRDMENAGKDAALAAMKKFITEVMTHYKGKIYSWDIVNEAFPDGARGTDWTTSIRPENPWFKAIGPDFVYEAYLAARLADPSVILYYNDYNTDQSGRANLIAAMVRDVNAKYKQAYPRETRLLIEGIGMQEHHNLNVSASSIRNTINLFRPLGVKISVSELDILAQTWGEFSSSTGAGLDRSYRSTVTNRGLIEQANMYEQYMRLYIENKDIIERVGLWGVLDERSWRSGGLPLLFDSEGKAKPSYYGFVRALKAQ